VRSAPSGMTYSGDVAIFLTTTMPKGLPESLADAATDPPERSQGVLAPDQSCHKANNRW
jgi:hypothetical protein